MSFGAWLWKNRGDNADTQQLYAVSNSIGPDWPIASSNQRDYERLIKRAPPSVDQADALKALQNVWPSYEEDMQRNPSGDTKSGLMDYLFSFKTVMGLLCVGLFVFVYLNFTTALLNTLSDAGVSRGVITFLIAIATVGIAVITVVNSFLATGSKEDLAERFRQGKDVLTVLIGVLGTIVGFYFAQATETPPTKTTATDGAPSSAAPVTPPKVTPPKVAPPEGTPPKSTPRP